MAKKNMLNFASSIHWGIEYDSLIIAI